MQKALATSLATLLVAGQMAGPAAVQAQSYGSTSTPIQHLVVIFQENNSFDHYFGTYPYATNPPNE
ncbi:MAG: phospholipase, partial [Silvibacterium sp.]|nr:phospholipase [Silvibacterium sp.]